MVAPTAPIDCVSDGVKDENTSVPDVAPKETLVPIEKPGILTELLESTGTVPEGVAVDGTPSITVGDGVTTSVD